MGGRYVRRLLDYSGMSVATRLYAHPDRAKWREALESVH